MNLDLNAVSTFIFDLDGVIWRGDAPVEGARESLARLREAGRRCLFATNNSSRVPQFYADKLAAMGISAAPEEVVTSSTATALHVSRHLPRGFSAYIVGEEGIARALESIGGRVVTDAQIDAQTEAETAIQVVDCVVAGIDRGFNFEKLKRAQQFLLRGAQFVATNRDATFPMEHGVWPGAGSIVAAIETASGKTALSMGKPQPGMFLAILENYGLQKSQAAMIGDRLDTDIAGANRAQIGAIFVATGVTSMQNALESRGEERPDAFFEDLPAMCRELKL